ncbi:MAG: PAS domain-containing protein [Betaproteobacteria bacterium]|nr:PAS domain-containing protein [Betaproteobacteria bacterium]
MTGWLERLRNLGMRTQMTFGMAAVIALVVGAFVADEVFEDRKYLMEEETSQALRLADNLAAAGGASVLARDYALLGDLLRSFRFHPELDYAMLVAIDGEVLAHSDPGKVGRYVRDAAGVQMLDGPAQTRVLLRDEGRIDVGAPVKIGDRVAGWSRVGFSLVHVREGVNEAWRRGLLFLALAVLVGGAVAFWFARGVSARLYRLLEVIARIRAGERSPRAEIRGKDELDRLAVGFNAMVDTLAASEQRAEGNELRLRLASKAAGVGLFELDLRAGAIYLASDWVAMLGYTEGEVGRSLAAWEARLHPEDRPRMAALRESTIPAAAGGNEFRFRLKAKNGLYRWILGRGMMSSGADGRPARVTGALLDVTERRMVELRLRESEARFRSIAANVPGMVFEYVMRGEEGYYSYVSGGARDLCGRQPEEFIELSDFAGLLHEDDRKRFLEECFVLEHTLGTMNWEGRLRIGRDVKWINIRAAAHRRDDAVIWQGVVLNITESREAALALRRSRDEVRELTAHQDGVREEEKARIAREIHDELGATLTAMKMDAYWLERRKGGLSPEQAAKLKEMQALIDQAVQSTRRISTELRPRVIDDLGIVAALEWQVGEFRRHRGIDCRFAAAPEEIDLDAVRAIVLFRIVQESLTNIAKHSGANKASVELNEENGSIVLRIEDNGRGIEDGVGNALGAPGKPFSHGLRGMQERAHQIGASLSVGRGAEGGTVVLVTMPRLAPGPAAVQAGR